MKARRLYSILIILAGLALLLSLTVFSLRIRAIPFPKVRVVRADVYLYHSQPSESEARITCTDLQALDNLVSLIQSATAVQEHACENFGVLTLTTADGTAIVIGILPGHDTRYYEIRYDGLTYRVDRSSFLTAVEKLGIPKEKYVFGSGP